MCVSVLLLSGCGAANKDVVASETTTTAAAATTTTAITTSSVAEKKFLDGYHGQTLPVLLAMTRTYRTDSIVLAIEEALRHRDSRSLTAPERVVLAVEALEREVNNGGYNQFFLNEPSYAHEIVATLKQIECPKTARITEDAETLLGLRPDWTDEQISTAAADMSDAEFAKLDTVDERFYADPEPIDDRLLSFIRAHAAEIKL